MLQRPDKMIKKNKKGMGLEWYMLIVAFFIGLMTFFVYHFSGQKIMDNFIGEYQFSILRSVQKSEKILFYIDQSAKYSLQQAAYDLAKSGGISEIKDIDIDKETVPYECGKYHGNYVWIEMKKDNGKYTEKDCFDESTARTNLEYSFNKKLNEFLVNYPDKIPTENYDYDIRGNIEVLGIAKEPLKIDIIGKTRQDPARKEEQMKIGEYSLKPSFKASIYYNIDEEYSSLKLRARQIIEECKLQEMKKCLKEKSAQLGCNCEEAEKDVLYDFIHKLNDCIKYNGQEILCKFSFDKKDFLNKVKSERNFEIKLSNSPGRAKAELFEDGKLIAADFINMKKLAYTDSREGEAKDISSITIKVKYSDGNPAVEESYASTPESAKLDLSRTFHIYKKNENANFIDLSVEGLFRASVSSINFPVTKGTNFCAKTGKQIFAYDESDKAVKMRYIEYKFAVTFPKAVPGPLDKIEALDALKSENGIILNWIKPKQDDIDSYSIYYSEKDFSNKKISDMKKDESIKKISLEAENSIKIDDIDLSKCNFDPIGNPCKYSGFNNPLLPDKLYYSKSKEMFIYLINDLTDDKQHYFAVTAVNNQGEISNDNTISGNTYVLSEGKNFIKSVPVDDLAPGKVTELNPEGKTKITWKRPSQNIDGSDATDVSWYKIYYRKSLSDINPQLEPGHQSKQITAADAKCDTISLVCEYFVENIAGLEKGQNYNLAVIPIDEKGNEYNSESERISVQIE